MFKKSLLSFLLIAVTGLMAFSTVSCNIFKKNSRTRVRVLMLSNNTFESRLLCELAQYRNHQPILLYDASRSSFYSVSPDKQAEAISLDQFLGYVEFLNPRQVIILGDEDYVPAEYVKQVADKFSVITIQGDDWYKNAQQLAEILDLNRLARDFKNTRAHYLRDGLLRPGEEAK